MKIKIELDGLTLEQANGLTNYLISLKPPGDVEQDKKTVSFNEEDVPAIEEKPKATRKKAEKVQDPAELKQLKEEEEAEEVKVKIEPEKVEAIEVKDAETVSAPTLMQIRSLVAAKAADSKEDIKAKLVELGAQNVSTLDAKHFQTIFDFLTEL